MSDSSPTVVGAESSAMPPADTRGRTENLPGWGAARAFGGLLREKEAGWSSAPCRHIPHPGKCGGEGSWLRGKRLDYKIGLRWRKGRRSGWEVSPLQSFVQPAKGDRRRPPAAFQPATLRQEPPTEVPSEAGGALSPERLGPPVLLFSRGPVGTSLWLARCTDEETEPPGHCLSRASGGGEV